MFQSGRCLRPFFSLSYLPQSFMLRNILKCPSLYKNNSKRTITTILVLHQIHGRGLHISTRSFSSWLSSPPKPPLHEKKNDSINQIIELKKKVQSQDIHRRGVVNELNEILADQGRQQNDKKVDMLQARLDEVRRDKDYLIGGHEQKSRGSTIFFVLLNCAIIFLLSRNLGDDFKETFNEIQPNETSDYQAIKDNFQVVDCVNDQVITKFDDVKGNYDAKQELRDLVDYLKNPSKYQAMGLDLPKGILLDGPPGTGKTLMARALAGEAGVPFITANGSSFVQVFVGLGAHRVRKLFRRAREIAPCIVFIDEIDAIGTRRNSPRNYSKQTLNQLLGEMDGFKPNSGIIIVGATNLAQELDPALVRPGRFDRNVRITLPDKKVRKEIIELYLKGNAAEDVDITLLAAGTIGMTGSDLKQIVNRAGIETVKKNESKISMSALIDAQETMMMGRANNDMRMSKETLNTVAFHEAGHALVSLYTKGSQPIYKATVLPRGGALGFVAYTPKDEHQRSKENYLAELDVCMGGRAAEEIIKGIDKVSEGASNDFQQASHIARAMVTKFGMSEAIGKVYYPQTDKELAKLSPGTRQLIDDEVRNLLSSSFNRAKALLTKHSHQHHMLAHALLKHETLSIDQIKKIIEYNEEE